MLCVWSIHIIIIALDFGYAIDNVEHTILHHNLDLSLDHVASKPFDVFDTAANALVEWKSVLLRQLHPLMSRSYQRRLFV